MELYMQIENMKQTRATITVCNKLWNSCMEIVFFSSSNQTNLRNISHHVFLRGKGKTCDLVGGSIDHFDNENQHEFQEGVADILKMVE